MKEVQRWKVPGIGLVAECIRAMSLQSLAFATWSQDGCFSSSHFIGIPDRMGENETRRWEEQCLY